MKDRIKKYKEFLEDLSENRNIVTRESFFYTEFSPILGIDAAISLIHNGFCSSPASTKFHGNYAGGLFDHSLAMTVALLELTDKLNLKWDTAYSPIKIGMLHDLCKLGIYKENKHEDGSIEYTHEKSYIPGHGIKSAILAQRICKLSSEECVCITHHMGAYEKECWNEYDLAIKKYPNVLYTHTADMIASKIMGV